MKNEQQIEGVEWGPCGTELISCEDTPNLAELTKLYLALKAALLEAKALKEKVGLLRGALPKASQNRDSQPPALVGGTNENKQRHYAFALAKLELQRSLSRIYEAKSQLMQFFINKNHHWGNSSSPEQYEISRKQLVVLLVGDNHHPYSGLYVLAGHNVSCALILVKSLEDVNPYWKYVSELPNYEWLLDVHYRIAYETFRPSSRGLEY